MFYIIENIWLGEYISDDAFKNALIEEVQQYVDIYYSEFNLRVHGEWESLSEVFVDYKNEKIQSWIMDLLKFF